MHNIIIIYSCFTIFVILKLFNCNVYHSNKVFDEYYDLAIRSLSKEDYESSSIHLKKALENDPLNVNANQLLG